MVVDGRQKVKVQFLIMVCRPVRCGQYSEGGEQGEQCHQAKEDGEFLFLILCLLQLVLHCSEF